MTDSAPARRRRDVVLRGIVWTCLAVFALLVAFDFRAKHAATQTARAWRNAQERRYDADEEFNYSELEQHVRGSPAREIRRATRHRELARDEEVFTWHGIFRSYRVIVYLGLGEDRSIEFIEGPGQPANQPADSAPREN